MRIYSTSATFTRPANTIAYSTGDIVTNDTTAINVVPLTFSIPTVGFLLTNAKIQTTNTVNTNAKFFLHLFQLAPTSSSGDNVAFNVTESNYLGNLFIDCTQIVFSNAVSGQGINDPNIVQMQTDSNLNPNTTNIAGNVYGFLVAAAAYTPASGEVFTVTLFGVD